MTLRPEKDITKILLSTSSHLVGKYEEENFLLSFAFSRKSMRYTVHDPEYLILTVKTSQSKENDFIDFTPFGDALCIYLSILYGKRFDNHGLVESNGIFWLPNYPTYGIYDSNLPFNNQKPRIDLGIPLDLQEIKRIAPLLLQKEVDLHFKQFLWASGRFYVHALQHAETQPEIAFLDLITCGEILSNFFKYDNDDLLDAQIKEDFAKIAKQIEGGDKIVQRIRSQRSDVKRKFTKTILNLLNPYFFQQTETRDSFASLTENNISKRIKAAYDLRSEYVHNGQVFGKWVATSRGCNWEVIGQPAIENSELKKILVRSPTLIGMERIIRFCLLRFIHCYGTPVDDKLNGKGLTDSSIDADAK